jgi:tetratricopeptide (TPR) repeat protein
MVKKITNQKIGFLKEGRFPKKVGEVFSDQKIREVFRKLKLDAVLREWMYYITWRGILEEKFGAKAINELRLALVENFGTKDEIIRAKNDLASTYYTIGTKKLAEAKINKKRKAVLEKEGKDYLKKALKLSNEVVKEIGISKMELGGLSIRANILGKVGRYKEAVKVFKEALKQGGSKETRAQILANLGINLAKLKKEKEAEESFKEALSLIGNRVDKASVRVKKAYAQYLFKKGLKKEAQKYLDEAERMAKKLQLGHQEITIKALKKN